MNPVHITREQLEAVAAWRPPDPAPPPRPGYRPGAGYSGPASGPFDMEAWIRKVGIEARGPMPYRNGGTKWQIQCPFNPAHGMGDAVLYVTSAGAAAFTCSHKSCEHNNWRLLRDRLEPNWRDEYKDEYTDKNGKNGKTGEVRSVKQKRVRQVGKASVSMPSGVENRDPLEDIPADRIPAPEIKDEQNRPEYASYQLAELLAIEAEAIDTNRALASRAVQEYSGAMSWCKELGWSLWNGTYWFRDEKAAATSTRFAALSKTVRKEASILYSHVRTLLRAGRDGDAVAMQNAARKHVKHIKQIEMERFAKGSVVFAQEALYQPAELFSVHPFVIGFQNGVWDNGTFREHRRDDYLTGLCPIAFDTQTDQTVWQTVLDRITGGDADFARTLQDIAGYCLSGASHIRLLPWLYGEKGTGKSTYAELLLTVLGNQAVVLGPENFDPRTPRERVGAAIWNKRVAVCSEAGNKRMDPELLKTLSGSDTVPARHLYCEGFNAKPSHVLLMVANDAPNMTAYDDPLKDRVVALPFDHPLSDGPLINLIDGTNIEEVRRNPNSQLVKGFVAWAMEGLIRVFGTQRIHRAECTVAATETFWKKTDPLSPFWDEWQIVVREYDANGRQQGIRATEERLIDRLKAGIAKSELRFQYEQWCEEQGIRTPYGPKPWAAACRSLGLIEDKSDKSNRKWKLLPVDAAKRSVPSDITDITDINSENPSGKSKTELKRFYKNTSVASVMSEEIDHNDYDCGMEPSDTTDATDTRIETTAKSPNNRQPSSNVVSVASVETQDKAQLIAFLKWGASEASHQRMPELADPPIEISVDGRVMEIKNPRFYVLQARDAAKKLAQKHGEAGWMNAEAGQRHFDTWYRCTLWWYENPLRQADDLADDLNDAGGGESHD